MKPAWTNARFAALLCFVVFILLGAGDGTSNAIDSGSGRRAPLPSSPSKSQQSLSADDSENRRLREGTEIRNESGYFHLDGDGAIFVSTSGFEFGGLPNLNLERVVRVLKNAEDSDHVRWIVSGTITEFSDRNFLLISRAVYKSVAHPPLPEQLE